MVKRIQFLLLFYISTFNLSASNEPILLVGTLLDCGAPPPSHFHITSRGPNSISVAWEPAWIGATHTLKLFLNQGINGEESWALSTVFQNISGSSITIPNLAFETHCKIAIGTNCSLNAPSTTWDTIEDKTILELVLGGRTPINPIIVDCEGIEYENPANKWIGFRVSYNNEGFIVSNLFEFGLRPIKKLNEPYGSRIQIKRVTTNHPIVAGNEEIKWPKPNEPLLTSMNPFFMYHINESDLLTKIGRINVIRYSSPIKVDLCIDNFYLPHWDNNYLFEPLIASAVAEQPINTPVITERDNIDQEENWEINLENPFKDNMNISFSNPCKEETNGMLFMYNLNGQMIMNHKFDSSSKQFAIPTHNVTTGIYIIQIKTPCYSHTLKACKI